MKRYANRSEVPEKYKWDLTSFFKDENDFNNNYETARQMINRLKDYVGCTKDADKLYEFLKLEMETMAIVEDLYGYAYLINDQELGISENIKRKNKIEVLDNILANNLTFFDPELLKLSNEEYNELFIKNKKLNEFKNILDRTYREKEHVLKEEEENIINELVSSMDHFSDISSTLLNSEHDYGKIKLEDGNQVEIAVNNFRSLMKNSDVKIRKKVYNSFNKKLEQYSTTNASLLNSYVAMNDKIAKIHKFKDSWHKKLFTQNFSDKIFQTLVKTTEKNLKSLHRYYDLQKYVLGVKKLHRYDLYLDIAKSNVQYSIEDAQNIVREALKPLGKEYLEKYEKIINNHYIDYCQYKGKASGAYSLATIKQDSRILMSFKDDLESISTIAHEGGHNIHEQFIAENNPYQYRFPSTFVCEVASLTNECLLSNYIVNNGKTKQEKLAGIANILDVITSNLFGAVREGKIEQQMYEEVEKGGMITKDFMDELATSSLKKYYGPSVIIDKYAKNNWITRSHYYMNFYLYSYAISISVATSIASKILAGDKEILDKYLEFIKCGSDKWPTEVFKILDIDLEEEKVYIDAIKYFDGLIDKYYEILDGKEE